MPSINDIYAASGNSNYLKVADLQNRRVSVTIASTSLEDYKGKKQVVLGFKEGSGKKFGLNKTNANMLAMLSGTDDWTAWVGLRITLRPDMTTYEGKPMPCIRVDSELPQQPGGYQPQVAPVAPPVFQPQQPVMSGVPQGGPQVASDDCPF